MQAERHANQLVWDDRQVLIHEATPEQARKIGVRKIPEAAHDTLRLIEIRGVDLCACGGTHVLTTGQIGNIQLRKVEKVKQGMRVEFVCGVRALRAARKDFQVLSDAAALYSCATLGSPGADPEAASTPAKPRRSSSRSCWRRSPAQRASRRWRALPSSGGRKIVAEYFAGRDLAFVKLYAQKLVAAEPNVIALVGAGQGTPALVFAQSPGGPFDAGAELKAIVASAGGRGGGTRDLAQGGVPVAELIPALLARALQLARANLGAQE